MKSLLSTRRKHQDCTYPDDFQVNDEIAESKFFALYFTAAVIERIVEATNDYAWLHISECSSYGDKYGAWIETTAEEIKKLLGLILFMSIVRMPKVDDYWRVTSLFHGCWARAFIPSRQRFKALMAFLHLTKPTEEQADDRLKKVRWLNDHMKGTCSKLYRPLQKISIDERMVKMKGRSILKQYLPNKPTKWGVKLFAACDVSTAYLFDLNIYTGAGENQGEGGLTQGIVLKMVEDFRNQNFIVYTDNFYTSPSLADRLIQDGTHLVGTLRTNRSGVPPALKNAKDFEKTAARGDVRYVRDAEKLFIQWKDKRVVTLLSTFHNGSQFVNIERNTKQNGQHVVLALKQPKAIHDYNHGMGGVDVFDSKCAAYKVRRKSRKYWKALFYDYLEIACVNSFILFEQYRKAHPDTIKRVRSYDPEDFRTFLVRQLGGIAEDATVPLYRARGVQDALRESAAIKHHMPRHTEHEHNCSYCYEFLQKRRRVKVYCPGCDVYLHVNERNCYELWHTRKL